ncbi:MAG: hypothetical protein HYY06_08115 [Deltaproteobacteria bacterium]|nr:hypothetical protein [Deltaproteobacteria bacterium]
MVRAESDYPFDQVWNAALRLIRVDLGFEVTERDAEGGFVLFKYEGESGVFNASIEVVRLSDGKVGLVCQVPQMPRYAEIFLVDRLNRKMREEYGAPPPRRSQPQVGTPASAGRAQPARGGQRQPAPAKNRANASRS